MKLNEIAVEKKVDIVVIIDDEKLEFTSEVKFVLNDTLLIDPITDGEERTIGFKNHEVMVICVPNDEKAYMWPDVTVKLVKYNDQVYHQLSCESEGGPINRRRNYRQYVGIEGMVNDLVSSFNVVVKDVSVSGCSFVSAEDFPVGGNVIVSFTDNSTNFMIRCKIVRMYEVKEIGKRVYGCEANAPMRKLEKYIIEKQRKDMQKRASGAE